MPTVSVYSDNGDYSGEIYDTSGSRTAYPGVIGPYVYRDTTIPEESRSFFRFLAADISAAVPEGAVVTGLTWVINLRTPTSASPVNPTNWRWVVYSGQTFIEDPLAVSDWDEGTIAGFQNFGPGGPENGDEVSLINAVASFDRTLSFDIGVWDDTGMGSCTYIDARLDNRVSDSRSQRLDITYTIPSPPPGSNVAVLSTPHAGI